MSSALTTENILLEFAKTVKAIAFYPAGHPNLEAEIEKAFNLLKNLLNEKGLIKWRVDRKGFFEGSAQIGKELKHIEGIARDLFLKRIKEITFTPDMVIREWREFLFILKMDADSIKDGGGLEKLIIAKNIKGILLNEMRYQDIHKAAIDLDKAGQSKGAEIGQERDHDKGAEDKSISVEKENVNEEAGTIMPESRKAVEKELTLQELLEKLDEAKDPLIYQNIAKKIGDRLLPMYAEKKWEDIFPVLVKFFTHSADARRDIEQKKIASQMLKDLVVPGMTVYLTERLVGSKEDKYAVIQKLLLMLGEVAMRHLLNSLISAEDMQTRHKLFNTLVPFGEAVRLEAEKLLDDNKWYVVRQMVVLLDKIGNYESLGPIKNAYNNKDNRVKKEVVRVLGSLPSKESTPFLLERLMETDHDILLQAIISLGLIKDEAAIEDLGDIAIAKLFSRENIEIRKEAIRSLGMIGGDRSIGILAKLLRKRVFWGRKDHETIRALSALSLGRIGGPEAAHILEEVYNKSRGTVHAACKRALEGINPKAAG